MNPTLTRKLFYNWFRFAPNMARNWLNRKLELTTNSFTDMLRRNAQAADALELDCEAAGLPIRS